VTQLVLFFVLGVVFLALLYFLASRTDVRAEGGAEALLEARHALSSLQTGLLPANLVSRIFAQEDLEFVSSVGHRKIRETFLRDRKRLALYWIAQVRKRVLSLWRFYSGQSRCYARLDLRTELTLAINFASLLIVCRVLQAIFYLRGPYAAPRLVGRAVAVAGNVCAVSERSLSFLTPGVNVFRTDSARNGAEL
jgi:hypothetical protein